MPITIQIAVNNDTLGSDVALASICDWIVDHQEELVWVAAGPGLREAKHRGVLVVEDLFACEYDLVVTIDSSASVSRQVLQRSIQSLDLTESLKRSLMESWQHDSQNVFVRTPQYDLETIGQLCEATVSQLLQYRGIGDAKISYIQRELAKLGLRLANQTIHENR